ncbi:MAG: hypothetical protein WKF47_15875 [Geodermatophilaceae bacterium]
MTGQPGLFDLPDPPPTPTVRAPRGRGRRGEHWTRTVAADLHVVDRRALRDAAHQRLSEGLTIDLGPTDDTDDDPDEDLLDPHEEIANSDAAAVRWWIEPTTGTWPWLAEALRLDAVDLDCDDLDTTDENPRQVRAHWSVTVTITDIDLLRTQVPGQGDSDDTFPELWNHAADPFAPLAGLPGVTWAPLSVEVLRGR